MSLASPLQAHATLLQLRAAIQRRGRRKVASKPLHPPKALEALLRRQLAHVLQACEEAVSAAVQPLLADWPRRADVEPSFSSIHLAVRSAAQAVDQRVALSLMGTEVQRIFAAADSQHRAAMRREFSRLFGVDILAAQPTLGAVIQRSTLQSVSLIRSIPEQYLGQVAKTLTTALQEGKQGPDVYKLLRERFEVARTRAEVITKDQMGKFYSAATAERHQQLGIRRWRWRTMRDGKVRPEHEDLEGQVFEYGKPPPEGVAGTPPLCRCFPEPVVEDLL